MRHRLSLSVRALMIGAIAAATLLLTSSSVVSLRAQTVATDAPAAAASPASGVAELVRRGRQLETQNRWSEALTHYERAHRTHPDSVAINDRLQLARIHYDLGRRYADNSFRKLLVNIGSVGQPRDHDVRACYVIIDGSKLVFRRVPYDHNKTVEKLRAIKRLPTMLADRLLLGK